MFVTFLLGSFAIILYVIFVRHRSAPIISLLILVVAALIALAGVFVMLARWRAEDRPKVIIASIRPAFPMMRVNGLPTAYTFVLRNIGREAAYDVKFRIAAVDLVHSTHHNLLKQGVYKIPILHKNDGQ